MVSIIIVGVGAIGSHVAYAMRNEGRLVLVDHDRVEDKNVLSQMHASKSVGKSKTVAMAGHLIHTFGVEAVLSLPHKLAAANAEVMFGNADLVIDCTDNFEAKSLIQSYCDSHRIPCLQTGMSADGDYAKIDWSDKFKPDQEGAGGATCEDGENLPFHTLVGAQTAIIAQAFLKTGIKTGVFVTHTKVEKTR